MAPARNASAVRVQELIGRRVVDASGRRLGRVVDLLAEPDGDELRIQALLVGVRAWRTRFGWSTRVYGRTIAWHQIATLHPHIVLHPQSGNKESQS